MKHTIKLLTVAITLAAILTLTGCPGPVNPDKPCTHEHTRTEVIEEATYNSNGLGKIVCVDCEEVIDEQAEISRFVAGGYDGDIPAETENPETYRYQYNDEDDYQIMAYVYSSVEDAKNSENERVLYFSFPNDTTDIPQIVTIDGLDGYLFITIDDLIQMKNEYIGKTVKYFDFAGYSDFLNKIKYKTEHLREDLILLTSLKRIYIVVE
jgi:hypothetical protein